MTKKAQESESFIPDVDNASTGSATDTIHRNASWGAIISIAIILTMVIVGAFYAWGERISQQKSADAQTQTTY